jgi:hypothetical protein
MLVITFCPVSAAKRKRGDEFAGGASHHHLHVQFFLLQAPHKLSSLISGDASGDSQRNSHAGMRALDD